MRTAVEEWLANWFLAHKKIGEDVPLREADYFASGWLTSMEVVEFVTEIEQRFALQFTDRDLQDPRFVTIAGLTELILERSAQTSESR
ncbi:MAG: phosphopantetheine-binding protein [Candidatus Sulfotelmatobacter sp.]